MLDYLFLRSTAMESLMLMVMVVMIMIGNQRIPFWSVTTMRMPLLCIPIVLVPLSRQPTMTIPS